MTHITILDGTDRSDGPGGAASEFEDDRGDEGVLRHAIFSEPLGSVPRRQTLTVPATGSIADTVQAMNDHHVGCALVVRLGKLVGIFTERDVLRKVVGTQIDLHRTAVEQVMTKDPDTLPTTATIAFALRKMSQEGYRHVPLVDGAGKPVGVVAVRDIVGWMAEMFPESVLNLPPEPGFPRDLDGG